MKIGIPPTAIDWFSLLPDALAAAAVVVARVLEVDRARKGHSEKMIDAAVSSDIPY